MKRILSLIIAFALITGMLPAVSANTTLEPSDVRIVYDIGAFGKNVENQDFITTNGFWDYETREAGSFAFNDNSKSKLQINIGTNAWWAIRVYVPKAGSYTLKMNKSTNPYGGKTKVYFGKATEGTSAILGKTEVGVADFTNSEATGNTTSTLAVEDIGTVDVHEAGEYIMIFYSYEKGSMNNARQYFNEIILDGGPGTALMSATLKTPSVRIEEGKSAQIEIDKVYMSSGEAYTGAPELGTPVSSDPSIVSVSSDWKIKGEKTGENVSVRFPVTVEGVTVYAEAKVTVTESTSLPLSDISISYDLRGTLPSGADVFGMKYKDTKGFWEYGKSNYYVGEGDSVSRLRTNSKLGIEGQPNAIGSWFAIKLYVPSGGSYALSLKHSAATNGGSANVYFVSAEAEENQLMTEETKVGSVSFYASASKYGTEVTPMSDVSVKTPGEYYIIIEATAKGDGAGTGTGLRMYPTVVELKGGTGSALMHTGMSAEREKIYINSSAAVTIDDIYKNDGSKVSLAGADVVYTSGNTAVATVDSKTGIVTGVSEGDAEITADIKLKDGTEISVKISVSVVVPPDIESVTASVASAEIEEFSTSQIFVSGKNVDGSDVQTEMTEILYESDNTATAAVDENGVILAKSQGTANITVSVTQNNITKYDTLEITVIPSKDEENSMPLSNETEYYDFLGSFESNTCITTLTKEQTGNWVFEGFDGGMVNNTSTSRVRIYGKLGIQAQPNSIGSIWALRLSVPKTGRYATTLDYSASANGGIAELFIVPATEEKANWTKASYSIGKVDFYKSATTYNLSTNLSDVELEQDGDYLLVFKSVSNGTGSGRQQFPRGFTLDGTGVASYIDAFLEESTVDVGNTTRMLYRVKLSDGTWLRDKSGIVFTSSNTNIATVSSDGTVKGVGEGNADLTVTVKRAGKKVSSTVTVSVVDKTAPQSMLLRAPATVYVDGKGSFIQRAIMASTGKITLDATEVDYEIIGGDGKVEISLDGIITGIEPGLVTVRATTTFRDTYIESNEVTVEVLPKTQKTEPTLFTYEMRENAQENIAKYDWAKEELELYWDDAESFLSIPEKMYNLMLAEGVPRARYCAMNANDPTYSSCKYCGVDLVQAFGTEYFKVDAIARPWKVQCQSCKRIFPSNDFESLYELGLNEKGAYDRIRALEENGILCGRGERVDGIYVAKPEYADNPYGYGDPKGYLYNELYKELYETGKDPVSGKTITHAWGDFTIDVDNDGTPDPGYFWGVDDGYGYYTGETYGNGTPVVHPYVANYVCMGATTKAYTSLMDLMYAYMYTDDIRYGRLAAVMLDRMADNLPEMSSGQYPFLVTDGGAGIGKIQGALNDCTILRIYAQACDILYPLIDDPQVIEYLSAKAEKYNLDNPKLSGSDIWSNWEDGILREIYRSCLNTKLRGGFGHKHEALATAAVVLDSMPETEEMLDWLFAPGFEDKANLYCNGGNTNVELVGTLDRDGFANHGSPNYNSTWIDFLMYVQNALDDYDRYNKYDLFDNPKFAKMFTVFTPFTLVSKYTAQIGDSGSTGSQTFECPDMENLVYAYEKLGDVNIAKLLYLQNGMTTEGIHADICVKDPEAIADEIEEIIEREGPYLESEMLTGAGFAILRDGEMIKSAGTNATYDSQRDFWMYFGRTEGHGHMGSLNLGVEAYGYNFAPDFGYPEGANNSPKRRWMDGTLAHNTVTVNTKNQLETVNSTNPLHFDAGENVGVMDVDSSEVYAETKVYRRTLVSVKVNDEVSYGVDFFKVLGGNDQIYSFRAHSDEIYETEGLTITKQADENGNYIGSYAGEDVEYGEDPGYVETGTAKYPIGFPFLKNIRRANNVSGSFAVDFKIKDFRKVLPYNMNLHLRMTALNDFVTDEVAITSAYVPRRLDAAKYYDTLEQVLIRRKGSGTLNSLFTTVYEPYKDARYIASIEALPITPVDGDLSAVDAAKAVKVTHTSGRIDYIAYATDEKRSYTIYDESVGRTLEFTGFVGVLSYKDNELIYS
ncbi:MAG: Ig-like domain-containing protein, partial [Oscillospiraceae bacterium]|nr:Ig-like domain-containing protein [Oscillospiraceae bacterium]